MPRERSLCCNSQTDYCSLIKGIQSGDPETASDQTSTGKKKSLGKGDAPSLKQSGPKKGAKKQKKRVDCVAPCGDGRKQQQDNVNMNRQQDAALGKAGETIYLPQRDIIGECCLAGVKSDGHKGTGESIECSKRHMMTTARGKLSSAKSHMKKLVHNTRKITVFEPREVDSTSADVNANKTATDNTKCEASGRVIKKHKTPSHVDKGKKNNSLNLKRTDCVPLAEVDNEGYLSETSFKITNAISNTGVSQDLKLTKQSKCTRREKNSATLSTSHDKNTPDGTETQEKYKNLNTEKPDKEDRVPPLSKQGTFLIEKPKLAWSSPTVRSKCPHSPGGSALQVETLVTCLQSPNSVTLDGGEDDRNEAKNQSTIGTCTSYAKGEHSKSLHGENKIRQSYSHSSVVSNEDDSDDDVVDDNVTMDEDSEEDNEVGGVKAAEDVSSPWNKEESNIPYKPLSWATTNRNQEEQSSTNDDTTAFRDQDIDSTNCSNCSTEQRKPKKMSRLKRIKKSLAKLPKGFSENFMNMLPSNSILLVKPKFSGSNGAKVNVTDISADDKEWKSTGTKCFDEPSAVFETVTMRHASMQANQKKRRDAANADIFKKL